MHGLSVMFMILYMVEFGCCVSENRRSADRRRDWEEDRRRRERIFLFLK